MNDTNQVHVVHHLAGAVSGIALAAATEAVARRCSPRARTRIYAVGLPGAAAIYPLARRDGHAARDGLIEFAALGAYAVWALRSRDANRALAAGWASHAVFDAVHHTGPDSRIPGWYPAACAGTDLLVALNLVRD